MLASYADCKGVLKDRLLPDVSGWVVASPVHPGQLDYTMAQL